MSVLLTPGKLGVGRIGDRALRSDGTPKVQGQFAFASDLIAPGMLWGHTVRSPHAHAEIVEVDISEAVAMPGVHAVKIANGERHGAISSAWYAASNAHDGKRVKS